LLDAFKADAKKQDDTLDVQQRALTTQADALRAQAQSLAARQRTTLSALVLVLTMLVLAIGFAGIIITHKVAGPIFKMKRHLKDVGEGHLKIPGRLRKGDELVDFFDTFDHMVRQLRQRQEEEIGKLDAALSKIQSTVDEETLAPLRQLRAEMQAALD